MEDVRKTLAAATGAVLLDDTDVPPDDDDLADVEEDRNAYRDDPDDDDEGFGEEDGEDDEDGEDVRMGFDACRVNRPKPGEEAYDEEGELLPPPARCDAVGVFPGHSKPVQCVAVHPTTTVGTAGQEEGGIAASGGEDDLVCVWKYPSCELLHSLKGHHETVIAAAFSFDGSHLITGDLKGVLCVWQTGTGELQHTLEDLASEESGVEWIVAHPKGPVFIAGGLAQACMWNLKGQCMQVFGGHHGPVLCGGLSSDGKLLLTGGADGVLRVHHPQTAEVVFTFDAGKHQLPAAEITCLSISPQQADVVFLGYQEGTVALVSLKTGKVLRQNQRHTDAVLSLDCPSDLNLFASAGADGSVVIWDTQTFSLRHSFTLPDHAIPTRLRWRGAQLLVTDSRGVLHGLDGRASEGEPRRWLGHQGAIHVLAVAGRYAFTGADDRTAMVFDLETPDPLAAASSPV